MTDQSDQPSSPSSAEDDTTVRGKELPLSEAAATSPAADSPPNEELSAEEQMALYEESLKDTDWGHQPC